MTVYVSREWKNLKVDKIFIPRLKFKLFIESV